MKTLARWRRIGLNGETLEARRLLTAAANGGEADVALGSGGAPCVAPLAALAAEVEPQYLVYQTPRLQPGNAPLVGTPAYTGTDQVDILWQTKTIGAGQMDSFEVSYRRGGTTDPWQPATTNSPLDVGQETRIVHSATILGLAWDTDYEYQVKHVRAGGVLATYHHRFHTRVAPGESTPFDFVAYGDSTNQGGGGYPLVQRRINQLDPDFALLLGDNAYGFGTHIEFDYRLVPELSPESTEWIAEHIDYLGIGNHDGGVLSVTRGQPSRDNYSTPHAVAGVNAYASPPAVEFAEFNYSFDYGNVHFLTMDMNAVELLNNAGAQRILDLFDYALADMTASQADWKVAYFHQPVVGTDKPHDDPSDYFFQEALTHLLAAGVDLVLVGDSHTYSWTHAMTGFQDYNQNGMIAANEVDFVTDTDRTYPKDAGLMQVVSGAGGSSLRSHAYLDPFFAAAYTGDDPDILPPHIYPMEYGFAHVQVTQDRLTVSYISAETGRIVGDTNGNWVADANEPFFGRFQIVDVAVARGDLNGDDTLSAADIDLLATALRAGDPDPRYDLNGDTVNDTADYEMLLDSIVGVPRGDANLDFAFTSSDLVSIFQSGKFETTQAAGWAEGDWTGDGLFTSTDLILVFQLGTYRT
jgi:hypothetical protein